MAENPKRKNKAPPRGLLGNHRYLCKRSLLMCGRKHQKIVMVPDRRTKRPGSPHESQMKRTKLSGADLRCRSNRGVDVTTRDPSPSDRRPSPTALGDSWEVDSGFSSEASPPASGRSSPCLGTCPTSVVALDCEMVGTGPGGTNSELARCSILDYHGNVLYDKYIRPSELVTDFRTRWSGIRRCHLKNATPFAEAREEVLGILEGKVVVGHSVYNDFEALAILHPGHMVRDTCTTRLLSRLAGFPRHRFVSLRVLAAKLLNRTIQAGARGHCSVEDAGAALDLYKLVEGEWEEQLQNALRDDGVPAPPSYAASDHYMQDQYWPDDVVDAGGQ